MTVIGAVHAMCLRLCAPLLLGTVEGAPGIDQIRRLPSFRRLELFAQVRHQPLSRRVGQPHE